MVELGYSDANKNRAGVLRAFELDLEYGIEDASNDFKLTVPKDFSLDIGSYIWIDDTEWGGIVDGFGIDYTNQPEKYYTGRTWQGILSHKVIMPEGEHYSVSGEVHECIQKVLDRVGGCGIIQASNEYTNIEISYEFERFTDAYSGLLKMCAKNGLYLDMKRVRGSVILSAVPLREQTILPSYYSGFKASYNTRPINHLVCAGEGENEERIVKHLYADENGNISQTQTLFGLDEVSETYSYTSADEERLIESGTKKLEEYQNAVNVDIDEEIASRQIGNSVKVFDPVTAFLVSAKTEVVNVVVNQQGVSVSYRLGDVEGKNVS